MRVGRKKESPIVDPFTHPKRIVCLRVAAAFIGVDERTLRARIESGAIAARKDGKVYRIAVDALVRYNEQRADG